MVFRGGPRLFLASIQAFFSLRPNRSSGERRGSGNERFVPLFCEPISGGISTRCEEWIFFRGVIGKVYTGEIWPERKLGDGRAFEEKNKALRTASYYTDASEFDSIWQGSARGHIRFFS